MIGLVLWLALLLQTPAEAQGAAPAAAEPPWVAYEKAIALIDAGELGEALAALQKVRSTGYRAPEVEMAMGDIFWRQAEPGLAEWHYRKAYELRSGFEVPADRFTVLYKLADMYRELGRYAEMEKELLAAVAEDRRSNFEITRHDVSRLFRESGLDRVVVLYRLPDLPAWRAHSDLAWYYALGGRAAEAVDHALFAILAGLSGPLEEFRGRQPDFRFSTVSNFLALASREPDVLAALQTGSLSRDLYALGVALRALGETRASFGIWHLLAGSPLEGPWRDRADRQLASPFEERLGSVPGF